MKEKDDMISALEAKLGQLQSKYEDQTALLLQKTAKAAEYKATAEARQQQVIEAKATANTWHDLADTLRKDQKDLLSLWK